MAISMYSVDYDGFLPVAADSAQAAKALQQYLDISGSAPFACTETGQAYLFNTALAGSSVSSSISDVVVKDATPHADGKVNAAFVSGIVQSMASSDHRLAGASFR